MVLVCTLENDVHGIAVLIILLVMLRAYDIELLLRCTEYFFHVHMGMSDIYRYSFARMIKLAKKVFHRRTSRLR